MSDITNIGRSFNMTTPSQEQITNDDASASPLTAGIGEIKDEVQAESLNTFNSMLPADDLTPFKAPMTAPYSPPENEPGDVSLFNFPPPANSALKDKPVNYTANLAENLAIQNPRAAELGAGEKVGIITPEKEATHWMIDTFKSYFQGLAADYEKFHDVMSSVFGQNPFADYGLTTPYSRDMAEALRQRALAGDYSWLPDVQFVKGNAVEGNGVYSPGPPATVSLNERLLKDPKQAAESFTRAVGYQLSNLTADPERLDELRNLVEELREKQIWNTLDSGKVNEGLIPGSYCGFYAWFPTCYLPVPQVGEQFRLALTGKPPISPLPDLRWVSGDKDLANAALPV